IAASEYPSPFRSSTRRPTFTLRVGDHWEQRFSSSHACTLQKYRAPSGGVALTANGCAGVNVVSSTCTSISGLGNSDLEREVPVLWTGSWYWIFRAPPAAMRHRNLGFNEACACTEPVYPLFRG